MFSRAKHPSVTPLLAAAMALALPALSYAQANRGSTSTGMFGPSTLGSTGGASPQGLGSGMTMGMGGNSQQGGAGGAGGQGGMANTQSQMVQGGGPVQVQAGGATGFVGISSANSAQAFNATGQRGQSNQNFSQLSQLMTKARQNQFNAQQAQKAGRAGTAQAQAQFRVPLRLGFQPQPVSNTRLTGFSTRLTKIPGLARIGPIEATLEGRTAVLRGTVATEEDRQLAEGLARLEPEILAVRNELVVGSAGMTTSEGLPAPASSGR